MSAPLGAAQAQAFRLLTADRGKIYIVIGWEQREGVMADGQLHPRLIPYMDFTMENPGERPGVPMTGLPFLGGAGLPWCLSPGEAEHLAVRQAKEMQTTVEQAEGKQE